MVGQASLADHQASHTDHNVAAFSAGGRAGLEAVAQSAGGGGDGGGGFAGATLPFSLKDYFDAREQAMEFRFSERLDGLPTRETVWNVSIMVLGGMVTALTVFMGVLAFGGDRFDSGLNLSPAMH